MIEKDKDSAADESDKDWVYRDSTKRLLMRGLLIACGVSVLLEVFVLKARGEHKHFAIDGGFGFYAILGFVMCTIMIFLAKGLGIGLKMPTDFYDDKPEAAGGEEGSE